MRGAETGTVTIEGVEDLTTPYTAGTPSLASITNPGFQDLLDASFDEFVSVIAVGPADLVNGGGAWAPGPDGGIFGDTNRGLNEGGIEVRQIVDKGLFSAGGLYYHATTLTEGEITAATIDQIAAAWGTNEALAIDGEQDDSANYSQQHGFYAQMAAALTAAKAYASDTECDAERDEAITEFFTLWETSLMSRFTFYVNAMAVALAAAASDTELADGLHELGEGLGLVTGFYGLPDPASGPLSGGARIITDAQIEAILETALGMNLEDLGASTTGTFVESLPAYETAQSDAEAVLMEVYDVDAATIAMWRNPTPG
jgi:hypothetical protein